MTGKFPKSTNFFAANKAGAETAVLESTSGAYSATTVNAWVWGREDTWKDAASGRYVMNVAAGMTLSYATGRQFELIIPASAIFAKSHRFVYKLDAFEKNGANLELLFSFVIPVQSRNTDLYGRPELPETVKGRFAEKIADPAMVVWVRRGTGEYRG